MILKFKGFSKSYNNEKIISIDETTLETGIYWLKGVNGAGKSTLLRCIAGFLDFEGNIFLDEFNFRKQGLNYRRCINFGDAEPLFPDFLTGMEMIELFEKAKDAPLGQASYYVESMDLKSYIDNPISTYSSGMVKKLSLILAFLGPAKLICLDEPLITLDTRSISILNQWICDRHTNDNTSFILSSHQSIEGLDNILASHLTIVNHNLIKNY